MSDVTEDREVVHDVDLTKRTQDEWCDIYHVHIVDGEIEGGKIDEFNFAYNLMKSNYYPLPSPAIKHQDLDYSISEEMQLRAMMIYKDLITHADRAEKKLLDNKYIQTKYVLDYR